MGLGPAVCDSCHILADYHPNKENPNKQGNHLCPMCGIKCTGSFFLYDTDDQDMIRFITIIFKENTGHSVS
jgi:hypothetical protein